MVDYRIEDAIQAECDHYGEIWREELPNGEVMLICADCGSVLERPPANAWWLYEDPHEF